MAGRRRGSLDESAVPRCFFARHQVEENQAEVAVNDEGGLVHRFAVRVPLLPPDSKVWLAGNINALGSWAPDFALPMKRQENGVFATEVLLPENTAIAYKYCISGAEDNWEWETGENRTLLTAGIAVIDDGFARFPRANWRGAGVAVPVFSLRSGKSLGCGEFADLPLLGEWAAATGIRLLQLLPVNDTTGAAPGRIRIPMPPSPPLPCTRFISICHLSGK